MHMEALTDKEKKYISKATLSNKSFIFLCICFSIGILSQIAAFAVVTHFSLQQKMSILEIIYNNEYIIFNFCIFALLLAFFSMCRRYSLIIKKLMQ